MKSSRAPGLALCAARFSIEDACPQNRPYSETLLLALGRREPRPNLGAQLFHGSSEALTRLARIEQLVGDAQRGEDRSFLGLDDVSRAHRLLDHVVHMLSHRSGPL